MLVGNCFARRSNKNLFKKHPGIHPGVFCCRTSTRQPVCYSADIINNAAVGGYTTLKRPRFSLAIYPPHR